MLEMLVPGENLGVAAPEDGRTPVQGSKARRSFRRNPAPHAASRQPPLAFPEIEVLKDWCLARADEWYARGKLVPAREFLTHAAALDPKDARVWVALGAVHYALGEYTEAGEAFNRAGRLEPMNARVYLHLALTHQQLGHLDAAEQLFQHALRLEPDNGLAARLLGGFWTAQGRHEEARQCLEKAAACRPAEPVPLFPPEAPVHPGKTAAPNLPA